ncbi:MAG TPA: fatty acid desaturase [Tepidisphaeraceae bacterium]|nr:fatty acid desaturase [Tepidisphaeraceae bacterium]
MRPKTDSKLFAFTRWDAIPALAGVAHFAYVLFLFLAFRRLPWWALAPLGLLFSVSISWNVNGVSHNFLHNRFFRSPILNRMYSVLESLTCGFSQVLYEDIHRRHHMGNADLPADDGKTIDPLSIYKHGHDGHPENGWSYVFVSFFRDDPREAFDSIARRSKAEAWWGVAEIAMFVAFYTTLGIINWHFIVYFLPFWYLGHCLSYLNGYYLHYGGNPDLPIAWGVSSYHKLYNWTWFYNGYHAEHHYRPRVHWTQMVDLHREIKEKQRAAGTRVIKPPHGLGFLDRNLPPLSEAGPGVQTPQRETVGVS